MHKDVKLLITSAVCLFLACFFAVITIVSFAFKLGDKAKSYDWDTAFAELSEQVDWFGN